jgi:hypothetical protein
MFERPRRVPSNWAPGGIIGLLPFIATPPLLCETLPGLLLYVAPIKATRIDNGAAGTRKTECAKLANKM